MKKYIYCKLSIKELNILIIVLYTLFIVLAHHFVISHAEDLNYLIGYDILNSKTEEGAIKYVLNGY